jgi:hypothetical protein
MLVTSYSHLENAADEDAKAVDHMREVLQERQMLIERIQTLGGEIPPELR